MRHLSTVHVGFAAAALTLAGLGYSPALQAQGAAYVRIVTAKGALDGGSKDPAHVNWIAISSVVSAGDLNGDGMADRESSQPSVSELTARNVARNSAVAASSGSGAGKVSRNSMAMSEPNAPRDVASGMPTGKRMHKPFVIMKELDKTSPLLAEACASGKHIPEVDVDLVSGGQTRHYTLTDVMISGDERAGGPDSTKTEKITFTYQKIEMK